MYFKLNELMNDTELRNAINYKNQITHKQSPNILVLIRTQDIKWIRNSGESADSPARPSPSDLARCALGLSGL